MCDCDSPLRECSHCASFKLEGVGTRDFDLEETSNFDCATVDDYLAIDFGGITFHSSTIQLIVVVKLVHQHPLARAD